MTDRAAPRHVYPLPEAAAVLLLSLSPAMLTVGTAAVQPGGPSALFWMFLLPPLLVLPVLLTRLEPEETASGARAAALHVPRDGSVAVDFVTIVTPLLQPVRSYIEQGVPVVEGVPRVPASALFDALERTLAPRGVTPMIEALDHGAVRVVGLPRAADARLRSRSSYTVNILLFAATVATTVYAGGVAYAASLLAILGIHEMGHYVMARRHGVDVTPPYFIPVPMGIGTFGAFIQIKSLIRTRRAVFDIGVGGPLAGLVIAIPLLYIGLSQPSPGPGAAALAIPAESSLLFALMHELARGAGPDGAVVALSPVASAAWIGIFVTALNLVPVGQLDGGHISYAVLGQRRARILGVVTVGLMVVLGVLVWPGLLTWALMIALLAGVSHMPALDDVTPPDGKRIALGLLTLLLPILVLLPIPGGR